jgi:hypothetical protein
MSHHRSGTQVGLLPTGAALPVAQVTPLEFVGGTMTAARANESVWPPRRDERRLALRLGAVIVQERRQRQSPLKLNPVDRHQRPFQ